MDWSNAVTAALVVALVPLAIKLLGSSRGAPPPGEVRYSLTWKVFAVGMTLVPAGGIAALAALQAKPLQPDDRVAVAGLIGGFLAMGVPFVVEIFGVRHAFDDRGFTYRSPWSRRRSLRWEEVTELRWRPSMKWLELRDRRGGRFRISLLLGGLEAMAGTALGRIPAGVLERWRTGAAVLELMRRGHVLGLVMSQVRPEMQVMDLPKEE